MALAEGLRAEVQRRLAEALEVALEPYSSKALRALDMATLLKLVWEQANTTLQAELQKEADARRKVEVAAEARRKAAELTEQMARVEREAEEKRLREEKAKEEQEKAKEERAAAAEAAKQERAAKAAAAAAVAAAQKQQRAAEAQAREQEEEKRQAERRKEVQERRAAAQAAAQAEKAAAQAELQEKKAAAQAEKAAAQRLQEAKKAEQEALRLQAMVKQRELEATKAKEAAEREAKRIGERLVEQEMREARKKDEEARRQQEREEREQAARAQKAAQKAAEQALRERKEKLGHDPAGTPELSASRDLPAPPLAPPPKHDEEGAGLAEDSLSSNSGTRDPTTAANRRLKRSQSRTAGIGILSRVGRRMSATSRPEVAEVWSEQLAEEADGWVDEHDEDFAVEARLTLKETKAEAARRQAELEQANVALKQRRRAEASSVDLDRFNAMLQGAKKEPITEADWDAFLDLCIEPMTESLGEDVEPDQYVECWDEWVATDDYLGHVDSKRAALQEKYDHRDWADDAGKKALMYELGSLNTLLRQRGWKFNNKKGGAQVASKDGAPGARRQPPPQDVERAAAAGGKRGPPGPPGARRQAEQQAAQEAPDPAQLEARLRKMEADEAAEEEALADEDKDAYLSRWDESHAMFAMLAKQGAVRRQSLG